MATPTCPPYSLILRVSVATASFNAGVAFATGLVRSPVGAGTEPLARAAVAMADADFAGGGIDEADADADAASVVSPEDPRHPTATVTTTASVTASSTRAARGTVRWLGMNEAYNVAGGSQSPRRRAT